MKIKCLLVILIIFVLTPLSAKDRIIDNAGLLTEAQIAYLEQLTKDIAEIYLFDLVIVTEKSIGSVSPMVYADDFFDNNGYGIGENFDGCLFLQVTGIERWYWFSTCGRGIKLLNPHAFKKLEKDVVSELRRDDPESAYRAYIRNWKQFLILEANGRNYNFFHQYNLYLVLGALVLSFLIGFIVVKRWKAQMNTAVAKVEADTYIIPGSLAFTKKQDRFLYSTVTKSARQQSSSSGGGSHTSSSGRSHGGGGGRY